MAENFNKLDIAKAAEELYDFLIENGIEVGAKMD